MAPAELVGLTGVTVIEINVGGAFTVRVVLPVTLLSVAEIVVTPEDTEVANPPELIVAMLVLVETQVTRVVRLLVLLSE